MTKQEINGRKVITVTAADYVDDFTSLDEVDFRDMKANQEKVAKATESKLEKKNVTLEFFPAEKRIILSYDL